MGKNTMPLLQNLTEDELASIVEIGAMRENTFDKNEVIFHAGERIREIGMVESGSVLIESNDLWGNCSILSNIFSRVGCINPYACQLYRGTVIKNVGCRTF